MISEIILSAAISLAPADKKVVDNLEKRLKKDGYDISQYIDDPRFKIYKFERGKKSTNYADPKQSWYIRKDSLEKCADFVEEQYHWLKRAQDKYGPSPEQITSQLELETNRGQYTGERPLINSFISVYLSRPDRRKEFYRYITDFLNLFSDTTDNIILPREMFDIKGSWAGAYGIAQGMPGIIKKYGKTADGDGDGFFNPMNIPDAIDFLALYLSDHGFNKNQSSAIQRYNHGHPFYGSSIEKHTKELVKIMEKRRRIPPKKIIYNIKPAIANIQYPPRDALQSTKIIAIIPQPLPKQPFVKRIIQNLRIGRR
jgi:membrane-bound lytic murein transglycosylase B